MGRNKRLAAARIRHEEWVTGVTRGKTALPTQADHQAWREEYQAGISVNHRPIQSHGMGSVGLAPNRSLMANLHLESPSVRREIVRKASRVAPAWNKGSLQYITG